MPVICHQISLPMKGNTEIENMTSRVQEAVSSSGIQAGIITIFVKHTTASVMIIEDEPGIRGRHKKYLGKARPGGIALGSIIRKILAKTTDIVISEAKCKGHFSPSPL